MGDIQTLTDSEGIQKIKELASDKICMFCTYKDYQMESRPMATAGVDDNGTLWFFSRKDSDKNEQLLHNQRVDLLFMDPGKQHYLALSGFADIVYDKAKAGKLWNPLNKAWFEEGLNDPELTLLKVIPEEGHYWDTKNGKLISMIRIAVAAITGKEMAGGVEGDILP